MSGRDKNISFYDMAADPAISVWTNGKYLISFALDILNT